MDPSPRQVGWEQQMQLNWMHCPLYESKALLQLQSWKKSNQQDIVYFVLGPCNHGRLNGLITTMPPERMFQLFHILK